MIQELRTRLVSALGLQRFPPEDRRAFFARRTGNRYWWHRQTADAYVPELYAILSEPEWLVLRAWFEETDEKQLIGECSVPLMAWMTSFISSNNLGRIVQLGTYAGYSTLLLGWTLRRMGKRNALVVVDIDERMSEFTRSWILRAGLGDHVSVHVGDSADSGLPGHVEKYLGGHPQLVFIDSSHQYAHTLRELDLWYQTIQAGSLIAMHDTSDFASSFDSTGEGGVRRALGEWSQRSGAPAFNLAFPNEILAANAHAYLDGCGLGLILKA